jgi:hypothetical protein
MSPSRSHPQTRGNRRPEEDYFIERFGYAPTYLKIGYDSNPNDKPSTRVWVNATCSINSITMAQAAAIFTKGGGTGDITHWSQPGIEGENVNSAKMPAYYAPTMLTGIQDEMKAATPNALAVVVAVNSNDPANIFFIKYSSWLSGWSGRVGFRRA